MYMNKLFNNHYYNVHLKIYIFTKLQKDIDNKPLQIIKIS